MAAMAGGLCRSHSEARYPRVDEWVGPAPKPQHLPYHERALFRFILCQRRSAPHQPVGNTSAIEPHLLFRQGHLHERVREIQSHTGCRIRLPLLLRQHCEVHRMVNRSRQNLPFRERHRAINTVDPQVLDQPVLHLLSLDLGHVAHGGGERFLAKPCLRRRLIRKQ